MLALCCCEWQAVAGLQQLLRDDYVISSQLHVQQHQFGDSFYVASKLVKIYTMEIGNCQKKWLFPPDMQLEIN